ncbi:hypothetical protein PIB30_056115, partial [Stylosanthes scabra]|nr:hypothetical protein [Stylosanthes scabra]
MLRSDSYPDLLVFDPEIERTLRCARQVRRRIEFENSSVLKPKIWQPRTFLYLHHGRPPEDDFETNGRRQRQGQRLVSYLAQRSDRGLGCVQEEIPGKVLPTVKDQRYLKGNFGNHSIAWGNA